MISIDGVEVRAQGSLLDACREAGADVPAFCHDPRLSRGGHCRACMVEVEGRLVASCTTPARDGLSVRTRSERIDAYRRDLGELMLAEGNPGGAVRRILESWGAQGDRYAPSSRAKPRPIDLGHPYLHLDLERCILCRKCVRACAEIQGQSVYAVTGRGLEARLHWSGGPFAESGCVSCGACVEACPSGAITDVDRERGRSNGPEVRTTCAYCGVGCQLEVHVAGDRIARIEGADSPVNRRHLCVKGRYAHAFVRHPDRLTTPLVRRGGRLVPASWDEALALIAERFAALRGRLAGLSSSRCTNEENYLFQKWFRAGLGTNNVDCCARVCHAPSAVGMRESFGAGAATNSFDDIERADALLVIGANVTASHPVVGARLARAAALGVRLVVIDPLRTELAACADLHLALRPGRNVPLLNALACVLVEEDLVDRAFLDARVEGFAEFAPWIRAWTPERWEREIGVPATRVREAARLLGRARRPMMLHGLGVTEHYQGSEAVMQIGNLALLLGAIGRAGVGVNPLRGQNNVQGAADMGCQPDFLTGDARIDDPAARARFESVWGRPVPEAPGLRLHEMLEAARLGEIRGMFLLGEDLAQTEPDTAGTLAALRGLEFLVVQELFLTETARLAHVVLPAASAFEKDGTFTNAERRIQRVRSVLAPIGESLPDWRALCRLMEATGYPQSYRGPAEIMDEIARVAPDFGGVSYARLESDGLQWPVPDATHPGTPILHVDRFPRGRGRLTRVDFEPSPGLGEGLTLVTGRVLEHYNAGAMTRRSGNRELEPCDLLEIHPSDAESRGIVDGARVRIASLSGEARAAARVSARVPAGVVFLSFHYPETGTNAVTGGVRDRMSGCPEYKVTSVTVQPESVDDAAAIPGGSEVEVRAMG